MRQQEQNGDRYCCWWLMLLTSTGSGDEALPWDGHRRAPKRQRAKPGASAAAAKVEFSPCPAFITRLPSSIFCTAPHFAVFILLSPVYSVVRARMIASRLSRAVSESHLLTPDD